MLALNETSIQYFPEKDNSLASKSCIVCKFGMAGELGMEMGDELPQSKPDGFDSSLGEGASGETGHFTVLPETLPPCQRPHLRGGWHRAAMTGGVRSPLLRLATGGEAVYNRRRTLQRRKPRLI